MSRSVKELLSLDSEKTSADIQAYIRRSVEEKKAAGVMLGLSGGIDSALVAVLAVKALGKDRVHVYFLESKNSEKDSLDKARVIADWLGLKLNVSSIEDAMSERGKGEHFFNALSSMPKFMVSFMASFYFVVVGETPYITTLRKNEIKKSKFKKWVYDHVMNGVEKMFDGPCKVRRIVMQKLADEKNMLLIGAGNKSEDLTGWFTVDGIDNMPVSPIKNLYKAQVNELSAYLGVPGAVLKRKPTADVLKGATDALALGMDYGKIDIILCGMEKKMSDAEIIQYGVSIPEIMRVRKIYNLSAWKRAENK
jgi:NAD+ synthase